MGAVHSPFRYAGGKYYARNLILEHIPDHTSYIEPFAGGASIFFAKEKVKDNWLNDIDGDLVNTLVVIRDNPKSLINMLKHRIDDRLPNSLLANTAMGEPIPALKELHHFMKNEYVPHNDLERAFRWFYLNRISYSGIMNLKNMYWGYGEKYSMTPKNWPNTISAASEKLQGVKITNYDFSKVINEAPEGSLLFIDPPYFNADQDKFYQHFFSKEDHVRLEKCLRNNTKRLLYFITYDNVDGVKDLYSNWVTEIHEKEWNYCISRTDDQKNKTSIRGERKKGKELFLLNYKTV